MDEIKNYLKAVLYAIISIVVIFFMCNKIEADPALCIAIIALITAYHARFENNE